MLRRRPSPDALPPQPEWQRRFDEAAALILSREQPEWVAERLDDLQQALVAANEALARLDTGVRQLDRDQSAAELKRALRQRSTSGSPTSAADVERRIATLRRRYDAVNDMINRSETLQQRILDTTADVELLAVQAVRAQAFDVDPVRDLEQHFAQLETDLRILELARREVEEL